MLYQEIDGVKCEPMERLVVDVPSDSVGAVIEKIGSRKGDLLEMAPVGTRMKIEFLVPARGLFGYRNEFLTDTRGEGIMASVFDSYAPFKGDTSRRSSGSLIALRPVTPSPTACGPPRSAAPCSSAPAFPFTAAWSWVRRPRARTSP